jgi:hypothetical protein
MLLKVATLSSHWYHLGIPVLYEHVHWSLDIVDGLSIRTPYSSMLVNQLRTANDANDTALLSRVKQCTVTSHMVSLHFNHLFLIF